MIASPEATEGRYGLRVGSTFSGVGGADLGLERAGFEIAWTCEWDDWKRSVLAAHWPDIPHYSDVRDLAVHTQRWRDIQDEQDSRNADTAERKRNQRHDALAVDLLCGGFPCQDISVAGKRAGFDGERSVLAFEFLRIAESIRPRWLLLENVPGLLSSNDGRDLARLLDEVGAAGYGWAYRILDARFFGVPQRRRRIFIVARRADAELDTRGAAELALRAVWEGSGGDSTPGWPPRAFTSDGVGRGAASGSGIFGTHGDADATVAGTLTRMYSEQAGQDYHGNAGVIAEPIAFRKSKRAASDQDDETWVADNAANTLNAFDVGDTRTTHAVVAHGVSASDADVAGTLCTNAQGGQLTTDIAGAYVTTQAFAQNQRDEVRDLGRAAGALAAQPGMKQQTFVRQHMTVRRLTPVECERLMGWPDNWTAPPGVNAPDSKRYAACGDGIVSWVAYWIGCRIRMIDAEARP